MDLESSTTGIKFVSKFFPEKIEIPPATKELKLSISCTSFNLELINNKNEEKNEKIFEIEKNKKKKNKNKERKCLKDDLFRKIKSNFIHKFLLNILNKLIIDNFGKNYILLKIDSKIISEISIKYNIFLFDKTLGELFDNKISNKYKNNKFSNHEIIKKISNNDIIKKILNYKLKDFYELFISQNWEEKMLNIFQIDLNYYNPNKKCYKITNFYDVLKKDKKNNTEDYKTKLKNFGINLFKHLKINNSRKNRKKPELNENNIFESDKIF